MELKRVICSMMVVLLGAPTISRADSSFTLLYRVTDLGVLPGKTSPAALGINDRGDVTGGTSGTAFVWSAQTGMRDLGIPSGFDSATGVAINGSGQIAVSTSKGPAGVYQGHAFRWDSDVYQDLGTLGGSFSTAYGIDDSGRIAGYAYTTFPSDIHAYRSATGNTLVDIDSLGGDYSLGYGINASGHVVGQAYTASGQYHAFLWTGSGAMQDLETLGGTQSQANDISDSGIIVGDSSTTNNDSYHAFILQNGMMTDLGSLTDYSSWGVAVNNAGQVIGTYADDQGYGHPFVWSSTGGMQDLNGLLDPITGTGWILLYANDINNHGQIVGQGFHDGEVRSFLLTPIPEPSTLVLLGMGVLAGYVLRRRVIRSAARSSSLVDH